MKTAQVQGNNIVIKETTDIKLNGCYCQSFRMWIMWIGYR